MRFPLVTTSDKPMPGIFAGVHARHEGCKNKHSELRDLRSSRFAQLAQIFRCANSQRAGLKAALTNPFSFLRPLRSLRPCFSSIAAVLRFRSLSFDSPESICKYRAAMSSRAEPATRHYDEKLQLILKSAAKIFAEKGFHHTSVRDISRATKMSLSGLYYYFTTKEELLYLIQERCFVTLLEHWEQIDRPGSDVRGRIRAFRRKSSGLFSAQHAGDESHGP